MSDLSENVSRVRQSPAILRVHPSIRISRSGLLIPARIPLHSWEAVGKQIFSVAESSVWWLADWLAYGEHAFQDRYLEAIKSTHLNYQTLRNYVWVARRFELSRRRDTLTFGHHAELAALDRPEQDYWLRKAEELGWSRNQLRREVRASLRERDFTITTGNTDRNEDPRTQSEASRTLKLILTEEQIARFKSLADAQDLELEEWAKKVLDAVVVAHAEL